MRTIKVGNDYAFRYQLKVESSKVKEKYDNDPATGTEGTEPADALAQADTQGAAQGEGEEKKKKKAKKAEV